MDVGIAQFWGGIAVVALTSIVNIILTLYNASMTSKDIKENIKANTDSLERELKTKVNVEVLSKNRQEWVNILRVKTSDLESNCFFLIDLFIEMTLINKEYNHKKELLLIYNNIMSNLFFLELLLSPKITEEQSDTNNVDTDLREKSNKLMNDLDSLFIEIRTSTLKDLILGYEQYLFNQIENNKLEQLRESLEDKIYKVHTTTKELVAIEWQRIRKIE